MNKKGFTLVELVVTVALLLALTTIAVISYTKTRKNEQKSIDDVEKNTIIKSAKQYYLDWLVAHPNDTDYCVADSSCCKIDISNLINGGYIENLERNGFVEISKVSDKMQYSIESTSSCTEIEL